MIDSLATGATAIANYVRPGVCHAFGTTVNAHPTLIGGMTPENRILSSFEPWNTVDDIHNLIHGNYSKWIFVRCGTSSAGGSAMCLENDRRVMKVE